MAAVLDDRHYAGDGRRRDGEDAPSRSKHRDTYEAAIGTDQRTAFRNRRKPGVNDEPGIDLPALAATPRAARQSDDAECCNGFALGAADRHGNMARPQVGSE